MFKYLKPLGCFLSSTNPNNSAVIDANCEVLITFDCSAVGEIS